MAFCIVCSDWYTYKSPSGLCTGCKAREDARYVEPEIPIRRVKNRGRKKKGKRPMNPITAHLREHGITLKRWCKDNNENYNNTKGVIARIKVNKRLRAKLEEQGLWELLTEE